MEEWKDGRVEGWKDFRMVGWKDGTVDGWRSGRSKEWNRQKLDFHAAKAKKTAKALGYRVCSSSSSLGFVDVIMGNCGCWSPDFFLAST